ncbi:MAG: DNA replication/repair protein RecF [Fusobacteriaceae bacterium]
MKLKKINFINFRNLKDSSIKFNDNFNLFHGKNGQGKTSILESIYFTATGKSFRSNKIQELIKYEKDKCGSYLEYEDKLGEKNISVKFSDRKKEYNFNGKKVNHEEFYGKINAVIFIPEDIELITGAPSIRRKFFDEEISQSNEEYYKLLKNFTKVLKVRNQYLKEKKTKDEIYEVYEEEFIFLASNIIKRRIEYINRISILLNLNYRKIFDNKKELNIKYVSEINYDKKDSLEIIKEKVKNEITKQRFSEIRYGHSLVGPQRDEFKFLLNEKDSKSYSSQGEKKSIIFSLKLSEIDMIYKEKRENPIFIIDDISSYFDNSRKNNILDYLKKRKIQLFISSTNQLDIESENFEIKNGEILC